jgi:hypothetical protein
MQQQDIAYRPKDIPLNGRLITSVSSALIGENDFSDLTNFVYTANGIETMNGMTSLSSSTEHAIRTMVSANLLGGTVIAYQIYPSTTTPTSTIASCLYIVSSLPSNYASPSSYIRKRILAYNYKSSTAYTSGQVVLYQSTIQCPSSFYLECITSGTTASSPPSFDSYDYNTKITDGTVVWIKKKGSLEGQLTVAPDNTIVFTNGRTNLIYGGEQHRAGAVINAPDIEKVVNGDFTSSDGWIFGAGWSYDNVNHEADKGPVAGSGSLEQNISAVAGEQYTLKFTVKNYLSGAVTPYIGGVAGTQVSANGNYVQTITASSTANLRFVPLLDSTSCSIDNVSVKRVPGSKEIDITDQLTNESYDDQYCATLVVGTDGKVCLDIGSPLKLRKLNVYIKNPNTVSSTVSIYWYTGSGWTSASNVTDGTSGFSQSGTISFVFSGDAEETSELSDAPTYLYNRHLYWYRIRLSPNSGTLPTNISLYYISCATAIQTIPNLWDGTVYTPAVFWKYDGTTYTDHTLPVSKRDSTLVWFSSTAYLPSPETTVSLNGMSTFFIGSVVRCTEFRFAFAIEYGGYKWVNIASNTMSIYYWNGNNWVSVSNLVDGTSNAGCSFGQDGVVYFSPPPEELEKKTTIATDVPMYYYKIVFSSNLTGYPYLDYVETIPTTQNLNSYKSCVIWNNRLVLANNTTTSNKSNELIISAPSSPYIWSGEQSITLNIGDTQDVTRMATLFSRYGTDITEALIAFKEKSIYYISGFTKDDIRAYTVSNSIGTSSPYTVAVCDLGIRITEGINRAVVLFANKSGVYLFDNSSIIAISDDISDKFQSSSFEQTCKYASGFYDIVNSRYHFLYWTGSSPNFVYYEYIFDLIYKKWTLANRGNYPLVYGGTLYDSYNNPYVAGFTKNYIAKLNTGNKMIDSSYSATLTTGVKPLGTTLYTISNIRRIKLTSTTYTSTSANLSIHCIDEDSSYSSTSYTLSISPTNNSPIASPVCQTNITGNFFCYALSILLNSSDTYTIQPLNISILYKPVRIDFA